ncbi:hypothetical protein Kpol_530p41 [Vanderwaltozyma polyspora DSM 70294]|uniref:mitogen-activated protein kinase kinase n=1 Tax=Vanderwaltozyma polyspora (strain ATCC 22028 / DSM 70294 / BCRC 21397 / CBS 2163 / NBRC 10782 / NRRL Y-8283 / UCD 57-17) TaxID=436907 RepID=A7TL15_VANPO|nr:uncharacterized protein Kpol_530p41 [Vanderwaltozyma polyspora DSM 70294]EDO17071.1 hypothetical protein Kpol_530p41 [Vanderwaltozyma polyspora DSM 70294]
MQKIQAQQQPLFQKKTLQRRNMKHLRLNDASLKMPLPSIPDKSTINISNNENNSHEANETGHVVELKLPNSIDNDDDNIANNISISINKVDNFKSNDGDVRTTNNKDNNNNDNENKNHNNNFSLRRNFKRNLTLDISSNDNNRINISGNNVIIQKNEIIDPISSSSSTNDNSSITTPEEKVSNLKNSLLLHQKDINDNKIELQNLVQLGKIGSGNSGTVIKALHVPDSRIIAKKTIPVETNNELVINQLLRELTIMRSVKAHPNIVEFYGAYYDQSSNNELVILLEYMNCGSLDKILSVHKAFCQRNKASPDKSWFNELAISKISYAVLTSLSYLYKNYKIIHRDIKPSNVLINSKGQVKICDFGVSKKMVNSIADTFVGTSTYMSPERIQGNVYSTKGDVWSLGLMIIELVTGEFPLGGINDTPDGILDLLQRIVNEPSPRLPSNLDETRYKREITDFVNRCCVKNERERSSIEELLCHDFVTKYSSAENDKEFKHWCKKMKNYIKSEKQLKKEETERMKFEKKQLERSAAAAVSKR